MQPLNTTDLYTDGIFNPYAVPRLADGSYDLMGALALSDCTYHPGDVRAAPIKEATRGGEYDPQPVGDINPFNDNRVKSSIVPKYSAFAELAQLGRLAAEPTREFLYAWQPETYETTSELISSLGGLPQETRDVWEFSKKANNFFANFTESGELPSSVTTPSYRELDYIKENWVHLARDTLVDHLMTLKEMIPKQHKRKFGPVTTWKEQLPCYKLIGCQMPDDLKQDLFDRGWKEYSRSKKGRLECLIIGDPTTVSKSDLECRSHFYLSLFREPVGAMAQVWDSELFRTGYFAVPRGKFCPITLLHAPPPLPPKPPRTSADFQFYAPPSPDRDGVTPERQDRYIHPFYPYQKRFVPYVYSKIDPETGKKKVVKPKPIDNPYTKAFTIVRTFTKVPVYDSEWALTVPVSVSSKGKVVPIAANPPKDEPLMIVDRHPDDFIVSVRVASTAGEISMMIQSDNQTAVLEAPNDENVPKGLVYLGFGIFRRNHLYNPLFHSAGGERLVPSPNYYSFYLFKMMTMIGGVRFSRWREFAKQPGRYWYVPSCGGILSRTVYLEGEHYLLPPYCTSAEGVDGTSFVLPRISDDQWRQARDLFR